MSRFVFGALLLLAASCVCAQTPSSPSDAFAVSLAQESMAAQTGGVVILDASLNGNVTSVAGAGYDTGTANLQAKGLNESRMSLNLTGGNISEVRTVANGVPTGGWKTNSGAITTFAQHNCWTDAVWFLPALSALSQSSNPNFVFNYIGSDQHGGVSTQHIRISQVFPQDTANVWKVPVLSTTDVFLDPVSFLPLAITFNTHPDGDMTTNIPGEIRFASYLAIDGVKVPTHIQKMVNDSLILDLSITSVAINSGLTDSAFVLQ